MGAPPRGVKKAGGAVESCGAVEFWFEFARLLFGMDLMLRCEIGVLPRSCVNAILRKR